jgi:hypothetical protein
VAGGDEVGETGHTDHIPCVVERRRTPTMSMMKRVARIAVGAILATGIFASTATPADAAPHQHGDQATVRLLDTGWGP